MRSIGTCPRCGGISLAEWLDGDTSCWTCGHVVYRPALAPDYDTKAVRAWKGRVQRGPDPVRRVSRYQLSK